ncbi:MAG TPA: DUF1835 domain-containing protein [Gammaproteobacteria bacterium]
MIICLAALREQLIAQQHIQHDFEADDPRKWKPLSFQQQEQRATELLNQWQDNGAGPHQSPTLTDAQQAIAQHCGFRQWSELKTHTEQAHAAQDAVQSGRPTALDSGQRTLHIRCGTDIKEGLASSGFEGDFLCFADPYAHGPVPQLATLDEFLKIRARYISQWGIPLEEVMSRLQEEYGALEQARDYERVMLWFEHDSHDQLILAKLLDYFCDPANRPQELQQISVTHFPGVKRFNGIGQLPAEALRLLWRQFTPVTGAQYKLGQLAWRAITASSPQALLDLANNGTPVLPAMAVAFRRHLFELPSIDNGLSLTEQLTLQILHDKGPMTAARLFGWYTNHYEPLTFCGDIGYWDILNSLAIAEHPALSVQKRGGNPVDWHVQTTAIAERLLNQDADWLELNSIERWVGGVRISSTKDSSWRIDRETSVVTIKQAR